MSSRATQGSGRRALRRLGGEARFRLRFRERPLHEGGDVPGQLTIFRSQVANYSAIVRDFCTQGAHIEARLGR